MGRKLLITASAALLAQMPAQADTEKVACETYASIGESIAANMPNLTSEDIAGLRNGERPDLLYKLESATNKSVSENALSELAKLGNVDSNLLGGMADYTFKLMNSDQATTPALVKTNIQAKCSEIGFRKFFDNQKSFVDGPLTTSVK